MSVDPRRIVIDRFEDGGPLLAQAAANLAPEQAIARPGPGEWSIAELVAHLLDCDMVWSGRMKRVIAEENRRRCQAFDEQAWMAQGSTRPTRCPSTRPPPSSPPTAAG